MMDENNSMCMCVSVAYFLRRELLAAGAKFYVEIGSGNTVEISFPDQTISNPTNLGNTLYNIDRMLHNVSGGGGYIQIALSGDKLIDVVVPEKSLNFFDDLNRQQQTS